MKVIRILRDLCRAALLVAALGASAASNSRPNIVVILTDDMGWSDIGCFGSEIRTPNVDRLAANGLRFTQFYNTARCCPTRAALLTGLYSHQAGIGLMTGDRGFESYRGELNDRCVTLAEMLHLAGYSTYAVGKWHVACNVKPEGPKHDWPLQRGFDHHYGIISGASQYFEPKHLTRDNAGFTWETDPEYKPKQFYLTDAFTDHAVKFVNQHAREQKGKPFFLYLAYTAAHWPIQAFEDDINAYNGQYDAGYAAIRQARWQRQLKLGLVDPKWALSPTVGEWEKHPAPRWESRMMQTYAAMVSRMDAGVGHVMAALDQNALLENTVVFYLHDNGACAEPVGHEKPESVKLKPGARDTYLGYGRAWANASNTPWQFFKHWEHEGGISTPLIVHWPAGIPTGKNNTLVRDPGHLIDLMPTCVDLAKARYPVTFNGHRIQPMEGISLVPAFTGQPLIRPQPLFWEHEGNRAVRDGKWKLVSAYAQGVSEWELYDLDADRTEMNSLVAAAPGKAAQLAAQWEAWAKRVGVQPWPLKSVVPESKGTGAEEKQGH